MEQESANYLIVSNPIEGDWPNQDEKPVYKSLVALELFKVKQVNTLLIALIDQYKHGMININDLVEILNYLEKFHFIFYSIAKQSPTQIETKYSKYARKIRDCKSKKESKDIIKEIETDFNTRLPSLGTFKEGFNNLWFTNGQDDDKKLIQYIFRKYESFLQKTDELHIYVMSLEHIEPQTNTRFKNVGKVGNLLPLANEINEDASKKPFIDKLKIYSQSKLEVVKEFVNKNSSQKDWTDKDIDRRTDEISDLAYCKIWKA